MRAATSAPDKVKVSPLTLTEQELTHDPRAPAMEHLKLLVRHAGKHAYEIPFRCKYPRRETERSLHS